MICDDPVARKRNVSINLSSDGIHNPTAMSCLEIKVAV